MKKKKGHFFKFLLRLNNMTPKPPKEITVKN